ncbi:MAG: caspase family protein [Anaerolineae bacterium]
MARSWPRWTGWPSARPGRTPSWSTTPATATASASTTGEAFYLLPYGYDLQRLYQTAVSGAEFTAALRAIPARKLLVLLDCCHAGGVGEAKAPGVTLAKAPLPPEALALLAEGDGRVLIASSKEDEFSYAGRPYSAFTLALIEALCGQGVAKQDGTVRVADLALHARQMVPGRTRQRQHPILHFEHADNFAVAYYAGGDPKPKGLPFDVRSLRSSRSRARGGHRPASSSTSARSRTTRPSSASSRAAPGRSTWAANSTTATRSPPPAAARSAPVAAWPWPAKVMW